MRVIFALLASLATVSAVPAFSQRIVGDDVTYIDQYPTIVALLYSWNGNTFLQTCGGTILTNRAILTAAHCPHGEVPSRWRFRVGSTWASSGGIVHACSSINIHPDYSTRTIDSDVAIMHTITTITFNNVIQAASIAGPNYNIGDNQVVWAAGWGTIYSGGPASEQLRHVQIWTVNQNTCRSRYAAIDETITDNMLCSGVLDVGGVATSASLTPAVLSTTTGSLLVSAHGVLVVVILNTLVLMLVFPASLPGYRLTLKM